MAETTHRVLRLLGLLEARTTWRGAELADRLRVTERTVRRDVTRLRELGYPVEAERGIEGGYRLGAGRRLPPLLLDDDEAVALVACLRMVALAGADQVGEAALRTLTKLDQVLPPKLRAIASALDEATRAIPRNRPPVDLTVLQQLALAQRDHRRVRFTYCKPKGHPEPREVEPARLMTQGERWYLQAYDRGREDWRIFRLDRICDLRPSTWGFEPRPAPPAGFNRDLTSRYDCVLDFEMAVTTERLAERLPAAYREGLEPTATGCRFTVGASTWDGLAWHMLWVSRDLGEPMVVVGDPAGEAEFGDALTRITDQAQNAVRRTVPGTRESVYPICANAGREASRLGEVARRAMAQ